MHGRDADGSQCILQKVLVACDDVGQLRLAQRVADRAMGGLEADLGDGLDDGFGRATARAAQRKHELLVQFEHSLAAQIGAGDAQHLLQAGGGRCDRQLAHSPVHPVTLAIRAGTVGSGAHLVGHAVVMHHFAGFDRQPVNDLKRFLGLHGGDDGGYCWRGGHLAEQHVLARQQGAGIAHGQVATGLLGESAFEAGTLAGDEDAHQAQELLQGAIHPGFIHPIAEAIHGQARLTIIEAADHHIHAADDAQPQAGGDVAVVILDVHFRIKVLHAGGGYFGFFTAGVAFTVEYGAAEISQLDRVEIGDEDVPNPHEGEVLEHLVAKRAGADNEHFRGGDLLSLPPRDQLESAHAIGLQVGHLERFFG